MNAYKSLTARECAEALIKINDPIVVMHARPDGDTVGAGTALCLILKGLGKRVNYACAHKIPDRLAFLTEGLEAAEGDALTRPAIAVDVASPAQLGALSDTVRPTLMIDHHEFGEAFADNYIIPGASSAAEVVFTVLRELIAMGKSTLTKQIAERLYTGISSDTGGFIFSNTTPATLRTVAELIEVGIDFSDLNHKLFHSKSIEQIRVEGFVASTLKRTPCGRVSYATISREDVERLSVLPEHTETAIEVVRSLIGTEIAFVIKENSEGEYKCSLRSTGANVAEVAREFSGGGHVRAAGCTVTAENIDAAALLVLEKIKAILL